MMLVQNSKNQYINKLSLTGFIVTLGIVYGDIGTSPLYVLRAIVAGSDYMSKELVFGGISCIFWTLTLQTSIKYVLIILRADNKGEGGIFALYALIRKKAKWVFIFAIIGGATLLADGIITPAITVVSAIEGLTLINSDVPIIPIVLSIITVVFLIQQFGTGILGKSFGPIMFIWFTMLGCLGFIQIIKYPLVLESANPYYAYKLLAQYPNGFLLLGAVFLCTTGAEALYSDLGHCGIKNIRASWVYIKITLILNYMGQGTWLILHSEISPYNINPFFGIMPQWFLIIGIIIATTAAVIASQALISGSFSIINEAISLNFWPKFKILYPTQIKGQLYIPLINKFLWVSCMLLILLFQKSSNMEAAYGLSITITMLMTTILMTFYLFYKKTNILLLILFALTYIIIEGAFLIANLHKFIHGGWVTILIAGLIFGVMYVWYRGREIKNRFIQFVKIDNYTDILKDIKNDISMQKYATNLVYLTKADRVTEVESKFFFSIINKQPKRADLYWLLHIDILDEPYTKEYKILELIPDTLVRIDFMLGFRVQPRVNLFFKQVIEDIIKNKEIDLISKYPSLRKHKIQSDFRFVIIDRIQNYDFDFAPFEQFIMDLYSVIKYIGISEVKAYGMDTSNVVVEKVPLSNPYFVRIKINRVYSE